MSKNDMKKGQGFYQARNERDVTDRGLGFNGQDNGSSQRNTASKYAYNHHTGVSNSGELIQHAQMPNRRGNLETHAAGRRVPPVTAAGAGVTGRRDWEPSKTENYRGNPSQIQERQGYNRLGNKD